MAYGDIHKQRAFTLVEMFLVLAIFGVLLGLALPAYESQRERTLVGMAIADIKQIEARLENYCILNNQYPATLAEAGINLKDPWGNPYAYLRMSDFDAKGIPLKKGKSAGDEDHGGPPPQVRKDRNLHPINTDYDLYSMGADHESVAPLTAKPSQDDIIRASNGSFVGLVEDY